MRGIAAGGARSGSYPLRRAAGGGRDPGTVGPLPTEQSGAGRPVRAAVIVVYLCRTETLKVAGDARNCGRRRTQRSTSGGENHHYYVTPPPHTRRTGCRYLGVAVAIGEGWSGDSHPLIPDPHRGVVYRRPLCSYKFKHLSLSSFRSEGIRLQI